MKQTTVTISGEDYFLTQFTTTKGLRLMKSLIKLIGPSMAELANTGNKELALNLALDKLIENLESVNVESLFQELVASASKGSVAIQFESEFAGEYGKLLELVKEIVMFNFGTVFTQVGSLGTA